MLSLLSAPVCLRTLDLYQKVHKLIGVSFAHIMDTDYDIIDFDKIMR